MRIAWVVLAAACGGKPEVLPPEAVATDQPHPHQIVVHGDYVYWSNYGLVGGGGDKFVSGSIARRKRAGGPIEVVHPDLGHPMELTLGNDVLYWTERTKEHVVRAPLAGGAPHAWTNQVRVDAIAVVGDTAYWTRWRDRTYEVVKAVGTGEPQVVGALSADRMPTAIASDGDAVYVAHFDSETGSEVVRVAGAKPFVIAGSLDLPNAIAIHDGRTLWTDCEESTLSRAPIKPGKPEVVARFPDKSCPCAIAADGKDLFVTTNMDGSVWRVRGGEPQKLSTSNLFAQGVAIDATHVYWANNGSAGSVLRVKRPK